jgi:hypothetical protein
MIKALKHPAIIGVRSWGCCDDDEARPATDFHNTFFGIGGKFGELFQTRSEREAFARTPEYQEIVRLRAALPPSDRAAS